MVSKLLATLRTSIAVLFMVFATNMTAMSTVFAAQNPTCPTGIGLSEQGNNCKITICHRDAAVTKPYTMPTVALDAADGNGGNDNGNGDHYLEHTGPVFDNTMQQGDSWGDIIPPIPGIHNGLNWTPAGQAIYNNGCVPLTQATPAPVTFNEACGTAQDTYTIPTTTGVDYKVGGVTKAAGTYGATGSVTVTAVAQTGYVLSGTTTWSHTFTNIACDVQVTPAPVTFADVCGTYNDTYTVPTTTGVVYKINGNTVNAGTHSGSGSVTVTAVALPGYVLSGTTTWTNTFTNVACPVHVTPGAVTFADACGTANDTYTIPTKVGVDYQINGQTVPAGTYPATGTVTVHAVAQPGYILTGTVTWTNAFTNVPCHVTPTKPTPTPPTCNCQKYVFNFQNPQHYHYVYNGKTLTSGTSFPANGSAITITAVPDAGYSFGDATSSWNFILSPATGCGGEENTPVLPDAVTFNDVCGTDGDSFTIPETKGVDYQINGKTVAAGTYEGNGTVTVTAVAQKGYVLQGQTTSWTHTFTNEACPVVDVCTNIDGVQTEIPSGMVLNEVGACVTNGHVLGESTTSTPATPAAAPELVNTGQSALLDLFAGMFVLGLAAIITIASRKNSVVTTGNAGSGASL